jgi:hypothetical protein
VSGNTYDIDNPGVPKDEGESWDDAAARLRGAETVGIWMVEDDRGVLYTFSKEYPAWAEDEDHWTVTAAWWRATPIRRRSA